MKQFFLLIGFMAVCMGYAFAQPAGIFSGQLNVQSFPTNNGDGTFTVAGTFNDPKGLYIPDSINASMAYWKGNSLYPIQTVDNVNGSNVTVTVLDTFNTGFISTGVGFIIGKAPNGLYGVPTTGDSDPSLATPTDYNAVLNYIISQISTGGGGEDVPPDFFYYEDNTAGADYSLPIDTLNKYNFMTISMRVTTGDDNVVTLPDLPVSGNGHNGKTIIVHFTGQEATPGVGIVTAAGSSLVRSTYCYSSGSDVQPDTVEVVSGNDIFLVYHTNEKDDYFRQCEKPKNIGAGIYQYQATGVNGTVDNGCFVTGTVEGITFERTGGSGQNTEGTIAVPEGGIITGFTIHFSSGQAPGSTYYINVDYQETAKSVNGSEDSAIPIHATVATKPSGFTDGGPALNYVHSGTPIQIGIAGVDDNGSRVRVRYKISNYSQQVGTSASILSAVKH